MSVRGQHTEGTVSYGKVPECFSTLVVTSYDLLYIWVCSFRMYVFTKLCTDQASRSSRHCVSAWAG